jgi:hypothetical protein
MPMSAELATQSSSLDVIRDYINAEDPYLFGGDEIETLQLEAIRELFATRRKQIRILAQRAAGLSIDEIRSLDDLVPLLFAHQTYKSYPETFIRNNQWAMMNRWLDTLSTQRVENVDVADIRDTDSWIARLSQHGHHIVVSSGTSGKNSFLNRTSNDIAVSCASVVQNVALTQGITPGARDRPVILIGPSEGPYVFVTLMRALAEAFARPGQAYWLSDLALTEADTQRQGELRRKANDGSATPGELLELEETARVRQVEMEKAIGDLADVLIRHKDEPVMIIGLWAPHFILVEEARRRGMGNGQLHPQSTIFTGGGSKGAKLPDDFKQQIEAFYGVDSSRYYGNYGMVEMLTGFIECSAGRYHCPPWVKLLILDREGENLLTAEDGHVEGRMAFLDLAVEGRWGGVITADKVTVDYNRCSCGRSSASLTSVVRYSDLAEGDDKLSCAGTMSSYIRGEIAS